MKTIFYLKALLVTVFLGSSQFLIAQEEDQESKDTRPVRAMFESPYLIDNQSVEVNQAKTLEFVMQHRFGVVEEGLSDIFGIYGPANIRLSISYAPIKNLSVGFGTTKKNKYQDLNLKYAIFRQTRSGSFPVSITYFGNVAIDSRKKEIFINSSDRVSYFHQLIIARKITPALSVQVAPSLSHFNAVDGYVEGNSINGKMDNDHIAVSLAGRLKISPQSSIIFDYDQPITEHFTNNPHPNLALGFEIATSSHAFQIFLGNYSGIVQQENNVFNLNDYELGKFLIGFNITRNWNF